MKYLVPVIGVIKFRSATGTVSSVRDSRSGAFQARLAPGSYTVRSSTNPRAYFRCTVRPASVTLRRAANMSLLVRCVTRSEPG